MTCLHVDPTERSGGPTVLLVVTEVRDSGVCSGHWTVVRDINDKRLRDDEDDDPGAAQSPRVGEPSSSSNRFLKRENLEVVESEARSKSIRLGEKTLLKRTLYEAMPENTESAVLDSLTGSSGYTMRCKQYFSHTAKFYEKWLR